MKTKISFLIIWFCFSTLQANSQSTTDNAIVNENCFWNTLYIHVDDQTGVHTLQHTKKIYIKGDSILNDQTYKKVFKCINNDESCQHPVFDGLIREENLKTYYILPEETIEYLLYDFSLQLNDTIELEEPSSMSLGIKIPLRVYDIDSVNINGELKKRIKLTHPDSETIRDIWVENLGSLSDFYTIYMKYTGPGKVLSCYYQENELVYKNPKYPCYHTTSISTIEQHADIHCRIQDGILNLEFDSPATGSISIFNTEGKALYNDKLLNQSHSFIKMTDFVSGIYLLVFRDSNGETKTLKVNYTKTL